MGQRLVRINELLKRELSEQIHRLPASGDAEPVWATVTRVEISADLQHAKVFVSVFGPEARQTAVMLLLADRRKALQHAVSRRVVLKFTPRLDFILDHSLEQGDRVLEIIETLEPPPQADEET